MEEKLCLKCPHRGPTYKTWASPTIFVPKIEKGIPIEKHPKRVQQYRVLPIYGMEVGDSFFHPWPPSSLMGKVFSFQKTRGWKFDYRHEGIGTRIWRIK